MFILILLLLVLSLFTNILSKCKKKKMPPGPWRLPILGNLHLLNPNKPHQSLLNLSKKHGPLMLLQLGCIPTLIVSSRDVAKEVFTNHDLTFSGRPLLTASKKLFKNNPSITFSPHGGRWRQGRKIFMLQLLGPHRVRAFKAVRGEEIEELVANIKDVFVVANLSELIRSFTNNIVCRVTLGDEFGDGRISGDVVAFGNPKFTWQLLCGRFLSSDGMG
ncbi:cytochrome P450 71A9-like [Phalaenopsis equestris]|uniref:cytochrome P450 71A9-like n=1 Tax=Phalaenopsis equestris TaxID=78828 RepID=UPI0009E58865|nr:cytochrome P450 71A9-like [Phalaenopsis equestris]